MDRFSNSPEGKIRIQNDKLSMIYPFYRAFTAFLKNVRISYS